jgi:hypothetical protein
VLHLRRMKLLIIFTMKYTDTWIKMRWNIFPTFAAKGACYTW